MADDDAIRAEFERWAVGKGLPTKRLAQATAKYLPHWQGQYIRLDVETAWDAWRAALGWRAREAALSANRLQRDATPDDRQGPDDAAR